MVSEFHSRLKNFSKLSTWELKPEPSTFAPSNSLSNGDMDPVPSQQQTWTTMNFVLYWISDANNIAVWELASSMLAIGLSWKQALPAIAIGQLIVGAAMVATGTIGARLHVAFPVLARSSFGFWLSYFCVITRIVLSFFWFGIQSYTGSESVYQMLKAVWPSFAKVPNHLSPGANVTSPHMLCYLIFWLVQLPFMLVSPQRIRWLFVAKGIVVPIAWLSVLVWSFVKVPATESLFAQSSRLSGRALSWAWLRAMNTSIGANCALVVNIMDFTVLLVPLAHTVCAFVGIAVTSAGAVLYGSVLWDPLTLIDRWDNRPAAFFLSFAICLAAIGTNVSANTVCAGNDMTALWPKYINIRRGQVLCAIIGGWALCPWEILATASGFLSFMSGLSVFLGPFAGIMITDFWLVHRGKVDVPAMYKPHGTYRYVHGMNWRAALALLVSVAPNMPGLINSISTNVRDGNTLYVFDIAWLFGFFSASIIYYVASMLFPARGLQAMLYTPPYQASEDDNQSAEQIPVESNLDKHDTGEKVYPQGT